jgi:DNA adenine methylase
MLSSSPAEIFDAPLLPSKYASLKSENPAEFDVRQTEPILKYPGGKRKLAPYIEEAFGGPCEHTYFEPFVGGASVFLHRYSVGSLKRASSLVSDTSRDVIGLYKAVADNPERVFNETWAFLDLYEQKATDYYDLRNLFNARRRESLGYPASLYLTLNHLCFNGLHRENKYGDYNVPEGSFKKVWRPDLHNFARAALAFQQATLFRGDFRVVLPNVRSGDHVYLDPPYLPMSETATFTRYSSEFGVEEHQVLSALGLSAARRGATVLLSGSDCPLTHDVYREWEIVERFEIKRGISATVNGGGECVTQGDLLLRAPG